MVSYIARFLFDKKKLIYPARSTNLAISDIGCNGQLYWQILQNRKTRHKRTPWISLALSLYNTFYNTAPSIFTIHKSQYNSLLCTKMCRCLTCSINCLWNYELATQITFEIRKRPNLWSPKKLAMNTVIPSYINLMFYDTLKDILILILTKEPYTTALLMVKTRSSIQLISYWIDKYLFFGDI